MQQVQLQQQGAKCPHGYPVGMCPFCSGMGGGSSKDKNKPRKPGEMSYNQCLAQWHKIQAAKEAKIQHRIEQLQESKLKLIANRMMLGLDKVHKTLNKIIDKIINTIPESIKTPIKNIVNTIKNFINSIPPEIKNIQQFLINIPNHLLAIQEKASVLAAELKNSITLFFDKKIKENLKKAKKFTIVLLSLFMEFESGEDENKQKIKNILKKIFKIKNKEENNENALA